MRTFKYFCFLITSSSYTGAQLRHNDFQIFADRSSRNNSENGKTEKRFNSFMIYKGQTCAFIN